MSYVLALRSKFSLNFSIKEVCNLLPYYCINLYTVPSGSSAHTKKKICKTCSLILVADYEFFRDVGRGSVSKAKKKKHSAFINLSPVL